ncbi:MAG: 16S rRNA (guanine(527)-N(7))-methyltransferase RsmG [Oscillospiraceae bacterium]|nr:16S rRNA (guanine(527)-N(7))-methyltransferase RsmG [Oscillospiraceae bacterium]
MDIETFLSENCETLQKLTDFMLEYNAHTNLTRITEQSEIIEKHYIDSILPLVLLCGGFQAECSKTQTLDGRATLPEGMPLNIPPTFCVPRGTSVLDVGSGAGFPGVLWKLYRPDLTVTLLDSARKRTDYLSALLRELGVGCRVVTARSEELAHEAAERERYGAVTARAVANLAALCEYCLPFVAVGGVFLALKGEDCETAVASAAMSALGGELEAVHKYALPSGDKRSLVVVRKVRQTPTKYPRKRINIVKNPIL